MLVAVPRAGDQVAVVLHVELALEQVGVGPVADGHEQAGDGEVATSPVDVSAHRDARRAWCRRGCRSTSLFHSILIFGFAKARSCMIFEARSSSRRWMRVTVSANLVRKMASSMAESPPPTTAMWWSRKKKPSQVAQVDTPWPISSLLAREVEHQRLGAGGRR